MREVDARCRLALKALRFSNADQDFRVLQDQDRRTLELSGDDAAAVVGVIKRIYGFRSEGVILNSGGGQRERPPWQYLINLVRVANKFCERKLADKALTALRNEAYILFEDGRNDQLCDILYKMHEMEEDVPDMIDSIKKVALMMYEPPRMSEVFRRYLIDHSTILLACVDAKRDIDFEAE